MTIEQFLAHDIDTRRILIHTMIADAKEKNSNLNAVIRREDTRVTDHIEDQLTKPLGGLPLVIKDNILLE
jgi:Asp-tRNA(Asn)/Glu-tRNA(Gln) amidotransferase A subunit family amidase